MTLRLLLLVAGAAFLLAGFLWPTWRVRRATGHWPIARGDEPVQRYVLSAMRVLLAGLAAYLLAGALWPQAMPAMPQALDAPAWRAAGVALMVGAMALTLLAQRAMGRSWRIGFADDQAGALVAAGPFARSRNPVFLGMRGALWGLLLAAPDVFTASLAAVGEVLIQVQVRLEEAFLDARHGEAYRRYRQRVRRWL